MVRQWLARQAHSFALPRDHLDSVTRTRFEETMTVASQRLDATDVLARCPHRAESIHVLTRALLALEEAIDQLNTAWNQAALPAVREDMVQSLRTFRERLALAPGVDAALSRDDLLLGREARKFAGRVRSQLRSVTITRRSMIARRVGVVLGTLACLVAALFAARRFHDRFEVVASASYSAEFPPERAVDGNPAAEWLAPDGGDGWIELRFAQPINVTAVRVVNAHNAPYNDRATKDLEIDLFLGNKLVKRARAGFDHIEATGNPRTIPVKATGITRVRFLARSHHGKGAGFGEVEVIEPVL
jgi:hypothetical protein